MILEIFLPEKSGKKRLLSQRIIGLSLQEDEVRIACIYAKRSKTTLENFSTQTIEAGTEETYAERASAALKKIMASVKNYTQIRASIPASIVTFKELQMPFIDPEKIKMVISYEIESMLPYSIDEAVIDFIITKQNIEQQTSQILVAAVRNEDFKAVLDIYIKADIDPHVITVDLFAVYGLYQQIPDYTKITTASALLDIGASSTRIAFLQNGELRLTRSIPRGIATIIKAISDELNLPVEEIQKRLDFNGLQPTTDENYNKTLQKHFINFLNDVQFTLNSFSLKLNFYEGFSKILFIGKANKIRGIIEFASNTIQIPCEIFNCKKIIENSIIKNTIKDHFLDWSSYSIALGTALPSEEQDTFNLRKKEFTRSGDSLLTKQIITALILLICMFGTIGFNGYMQINNLKAAIVSAENKAISQLKPILPKDKQNKKMTIQKLFKEAEQILKDKADLWASFSDTLRMHPLEILLEISTIFEKNLDEITTTELTMTHQGTTIGRSSKDEGGITVNIDGFFKSKRGSGTHFNDWSSLEAKFKESTYFTLIEVNTAPALEDKGIKIPIKLKVNPQNQIEK